MAELQHSVLGMYLESDAIFSCAAASPLCVSSDTETRYEPGVGTYVDLRSTTPIAFDFREVAELMWQETNSIRSFRDKTCVVVRRKIVRIVRKCGVDLMNVLYSPDPAN